MALPVVTTHATGCADSVQDGVTGLRVPVRDAAALAAALARYLGSPALRRAHGAAGRERMLRDFRPEALWEATLARYRALLARQGAAAPSPLPLPEETQREAQRPAPPARAAAQGRG